MSISFQACKIIIILSISNFTTHFQTPKRKKEKKKKNNYYIYIVCSKLKQILFNKRAEKNGQENGQ